MMGAVKPHRDGDDAYPVGVMFDNKCFVVWINAQDMAAGLDSLSLADVVFHGEQADLPRNADRTVVGRVHQHVRTWAREQGMAVNERGEVTRDVLGAYLDAHGFTTMDEASGFPWSRRTCD